MNGHGSWAWTWGVSLNRPAELIQGLFNDVT